MFGTLKGYTFPNKISIRKKWGNLHSQCNTPVKALLAKNIRELCMFGLYSNSTLHLLMRRAQFTPWPGESKRGVTITAYETKTPPSSYERRRFKSPVTRNFRRLPPLGGKSWISSAERHGTAESDWLRRNFESLSCPQPKCRFRHQPKCFLHPWWFGSCRCSRELGSR